MYRYLLAFVCGFLLWSFATFGLAQEALGGALELTADSIEYDVETGNSIYRGNVVIKQGDAQIYGEVIEIKTQDGVIKNLVTKQGPGGFTLKMKDNDVLEGRAQYLSYDASKRIIRLRGDAHVKKNKQDIKGHEFVYDMKRGVLHVSSDESSRVKMLLDIAPQKEPRQKEPRRVRKSKPKRR